MIITKCPGCGQSAKVPENLVGKRVKCPGCGDPFTVAAGAAPAPAKKPASSAAVKPAPKPAIRPAPKPAPPPMAEDDLEVVEGAPTRRGAAPPEHDEGEPRVTGTGLGIQYMRAYKYVFANPKWFMNLILTAIGSIIPFVGTGYFFDVVEALHREGDESYPTFDFGRIGKYFMRGLWPSLFGLIVGFPFGLIMMVLNIVVTIVAATLPQTVATIISLLFGLVLLAIVFLFVLGMVPALLRVGFSRQLAFGETISFARDFLQRVGLTLVLAQLFMSVTMPLVFLGGMLMCCVGLIPALPLIFLAHANMTYQLYEVYLDRGGQPIPLQAEE
jgi:hypothetical protein